MDLSSQEKPNSYEYSKYNVTFTIDFPNTYYDYLLANVIDSFLLLFW